MADKMRVLLLAQRFELRGRSRYTMRLCNAFTQRGIDFEVITPDAQMLNPEDILKWHISEYRHLDLPIWAGVIPVRTVIGAVETSPHVPEGVARPPELAHYPEGETLDKALRETQRIYEGG